MEISIKQWELADAQALADTLNNQKVRKNLRDGLPNPYTKEDGESFIAYIKGAGEAEYAFAVVVDGVVAGNIGFIRGQNIHSRTAELGYYLHEGFWGRGVMTAAVRQACARIFDSTDIIRIYAEPFSHNIGSRRVLEKAGFVLEGTLRANAVKDGVVLDMMMYGLVKI